MGVYTTEQYQTLCAMIAKGVTSLEVNGEKVAFRSLSDMRKIKAEMEADLGLTTRSKASWPTYAKE